MKLGVKIAIVLALTVILGLFWRGLQMDPRAIPSVLLGKPAMPFSGADLMSGKPVSLAQFKGKVVLVNFWASWCTECAREHANLLRLQKQFADRPGFAMVGVVYQDKQEDARAFLEQKGAAYPSILDDKGAIGIDYGVYGVPESFLVDQAGVIRCKLTGPLVADNWDKVAGRWIPALLAGKELKSCD